MSANADGLTPRMRQLTWRRRVNVLVCLVALFGALLSHTDAAGAKAAPDMAAVATSLSDAPSQPHHSLLGHDCRQDTQCSAQAVLEPAAALNSHRSDVAQPLVELLAGNQVISPLPHPPKTAPQL